MFHGDTQGRSYGNERVEISWESDYCLEFGWIRVVTFTGDAEKYYATFRVHCVLSRFHPTDGIFVAAR